MSERHECSGLLEASATCVDCGWENDSRNAMGSGAQHARRTGHYVQTYQAISKNYNCTREHPRRK